MLAAVAIDHDSKSGTDNSACSGTYTSAPEVGERNTTIANPPISYYCCTELDPSTTNQGYTPEAVVMWHPQPHVGAPQVHCSSNVQLAKRVIATCIAYGRRIRQA